METKKQFMYVINPTIRSNTHAAFSLWSLILVVICFMLSKISLLPLSLSLPNLH